MLPNMISPKALAKVLGMQPETIRDWIHTGKIQGYQLTPKGAWFIPLSELPDWVKQAYRKQLEEKEDVNA